MEALKRRPMEGAVVVKLRNAASASRQSSQCSYRSKRLFLTDVAPCRRCSMWNSREVIQLKRSRTQNVAGSHKEKLREQRCWAALNEASGIANGVEVLDRKQRRKRATLPLVFSLDRRKVDVRELSFLLASAGLSTGLLDREMRSNRWDLKRLQKAINNSTSIVAAFTRSSLEEDYMPERPAPSSSQSSLLGALTGQTGGGLLNWWEDQQTKLHGPLKLVGFARTTSDSSLVGAIHDIVVAPCARGQGIGKRLVKIAVRELLRQDIDDIAVLSRPQLRPFFEDCGFGPDQMESTFMFYTSSETPPPLQYPYPVKRPADLFRERTLQNDQRPC